MSLHRTELTFGTGPTSSVSPRTRGLGLYDPPLPTKTLASSVQTVFIFVLNGTVRSLNPLIIFVEKTIHQIKVFPNLSTYCLEDEVIYVFLSHRGSSATVNVLEGKSVTPPVLREWPDNRLVTRPTSYSSNHIILFELCLIPDVSLELRSRMNDTGTRSRIGKTVRVLRRLPIYSINVLDVIQVISFQSY